ncbi:MAG: hypothetical protein H0X73_07365 [Chthoniobacterales bacterium]|nr:hypothetical protein [Chthoniobacterales bacterium]
MSGTSRLAKFFGLKRNLVILLTATFAIGAGEELWMRFLPKYLHALGATVSIIGLFDALRNFLGAIYAYPGGIFVHRWGHRHAFIAFDSRLRARPAHPSLGRQSLPACSSFLSWTCFSLPASFSLIGACSPRTAMQPASACWL